MAKYYASQVAMSVSGSAIEWAGGVGFTRETGIEKFWRDSKIVSFTSYLFFLLFYTFGFYTRAHRPEKERERARPASALEGGVVAAGEGSEA